jgi:hypothetical protein
MVPMYPARVVARVLTKVVPDGDCWISTYSVGSHGYPQVGWQREDGRVTMTTAHRVAWWAVNQRPIPPGITVDHVCRRKRCVNPAHLRLLTNPENAAGSSGNRNGDMCRNGLHPWVEENIDRWGGRTRCRPCRQARQRKV